MESRRMMLLLLIVGLATMIGCDENERLADMAQDATQRQAEQNQAMIRLNREVAQSNQRVIEADAQARQEVLQVQRDLIARDTEGRQELNALQQAVHTTVSQERSSLDRQHEKLDDERRDIAQDRRWDSVLGPAIAGFGVILACLAPVVLAIYLLRSIHNETPSDAELAELLLQEIASDKSVLFGPVGHGLPCLELEQDSSGLLPAPAEDHQDSEHSEA